MTHEQREGTVVVGDDRQGIRHDPRQIVLVGSQREQRVKRLGSQEPASEDPGAHRRLERRGVGNGATPVRV